MTLPPVAGGASEAHTDRVRTNRTEGAPPPRRALSPWLWKIATFSSVISLHDPLLDDRLDRGKRNVSQGVQSPGEYHDDDQVSNEQKRKNCAPSWGTMGARASAIRARTVPPLMWHRTPRVDRPMEKGSRWCWIASTTTSTTREETSKGLWRPRAQRWANRTRFRLWCPNET